MVVEPAPLVPREHDGRVPPVRHAHDPVDEVGRPVLAVAERRAAGMVAAVVRRHDPGDGAQVTLVEVARQPAERMHVAGVGVALADRLDRVVGHPAVAVAVLGRPVLAPRDAAAAELGADRVDRKARRHVHDHAVADDRHRQVRRPVAAPVLDSEVGAVDRPRGRRGDRVEVVGEARRVAGRERVVEQRIALRPAPVGGQLVRGMPSYRRASCACRPCPASSRTRSSRRRRCRSPRRGGCAAGRSGRRGAGAA